VAREIPNGERKRGMKNPNCPNSDKSIYESGDVFIKKWYVLLKHPKIPGG